MKLYSWNVNGIRAAHKKGFLDWLLTEQPDILGIQEIKAMPAQLPFELLEIPGYYIQWNPAQRKGYSGTALFTKSKPISIRNGMGIKKFDSEGRTIIAEYPDFVFMNIYYPNGKMNAERLRFKMDFYDAFLEKADELKSQGKNLIITGDFNTAHEEIDLARPKQNETVSGFLPEERAWLDRFISHGYVDTFRYFHPDEPDHYTWWSMRANARANNVGWRIDYFFVNEEFLPRVKNAFILHDVKGSDHCPLGIETE